jgi:hypothetical protein
MESQFQLFFSYRNKKCKKNPRLLAVNKYIYKTTNVPVVFMALFWAQMALASLVPFQGPKKSRFSGPTPSNAPRNDVAPLKTITYHAIKTTGTLIVILSPLQVSLIHPVRLTEFSVNFFYSVGPYTERIDI